MAICDPHSTDIDAVSDLYGYDLYSYGLYSDGSADIDAVSDLYSYGPYSYGSADIDAVSDLAKQHRHDGRVLEEERRAQRDRGAARRAAVALAQPDVLEQVGLPPASFCAQEKKHLRGVPPIPAGPIGTRHLKAQAQGAVRVASRFTSGYSYVRDTSGAVYRRYC